MLKQRWMYCLGQVVRMEDDRMPKELIHEELSQGTSATGRLQLRFNDVCKRDLKALQINTQTEEATASIIADRLWTKGSGPYQRLLVFLCAVATACILPTHFMGGAFTLYTTKTKKENNTGGKEVMGARERNETCVPTDNRHFQIIFPQWLCSLSVNTIVLCPVAKKLSYQFDSDTTRS